MQPTAILESALYVTDLGAAEAFYSEVLGLERIAKAEGRHVFFRCGQGVLLLFNAEATRHPPPPDAKLPVPPHGTAGEGHLCFSATADEIDRWKAALEAERHRRSRPISNGRTAAARSISAILPAIRSNSPNRESGGFDARARRQEDRGGEPQCGQAARIRRPDGAVRLRGEVGEGTRPAGARRDRHDLRGERLHQGVCGGAARPACRRWPTIPG